jgi:hypothetical protein
MVGLVGRFVRLIIRRSYIKTVLGLSAPGSQAVRLLHRVMLQVVVREATSPGVSLC